MCRRLDTPASRTGREAVIAVGLFVLALAFQLPLVDRWIAYTDEGLVLQTAAEINRGKVPYRDIIIPGPGPAAFYLLAGVFRLTGPTFAASRLAMAVVSSAMAPLTYLLARGAMGRAPALLAALAFVACRLWAFPHWLFFHYSSCAVFLASVAYAVLLRGVSHDRLVPTAVAGSAGALTFLSRQDIGAASLAGLGLGALLLGRPRRFAQVGALAAGVVIVLIPVLVLFSAAGALGPLLDQTVLGPFHGRIRGLADVTYLRRPALLPLVGQDPALRARMAEYAPAVLVTTRWAAITQSPLYRTTAVWDGALKLVYFLPHATLLVAALLVLGWWWRPSPVSESRRRGGTLLVLLATALLASFNPPQDWVHLLVLYHPTLLLGALLLDRLAHRGGVGVRRSLLASTAVAVFASLLVTVQLTREIRSAFDSPVVTPAGIVNLKSGEAQVLGGVLQHIATETAPHEPLPVIPYHPMIQFLAGRTAGLSSSYFWPIRPRDDTDARLIGELEASKPRTIIYSPSQYGDLGSFRDRFPELFAYLVEHFEIARTFTPPTAWGIIFCALARRPATAQKPLGDLTARLDQATVTVGDATARRVLSGAERTAAAGHTLWPFRSVLYERPTRGGETRVAFPLRIPARARLRFGYGFNPDLWVSLTPANVTFSVLAISPEGSERTLFRRTCDPQRSPGDRKWSEAEVDLADLGGRDVTLVLVTTTDKPAGERADLAGWAEPRLTDALSNAADPHGPRLPEGDLPVVTDTARPG